MIKAKSIREKIRRNKSKKIQKNHHKKRRQQLKKELGVYGGREREELTRADVHHIGPRLCSHIHPFVPLHSCMPPHVLKEDGGVLLQPRQSTLYIIPEFCV